MANKSEKRVFEYQINTGNAIDAVKRLISSLDAYEASLNSTTSYVKKFRDAVNSSTASVGRSFKKMAQQAGNAADVTDKGLGKILDSVSKVVQVTKSAVASIGVEFNKWKSHMSNITSKMRASYNVAAQIWPNHARLLSSVGQAYRRVANLASNHISKQKVLSAAQKASNAVFKQFQSIINSSKSSVKQFGNSIKDVSVQMGKTNVITKNLASAFKLLIGYKLSDFFARSVTEAVHYTEVLNMFNTVMDESIDVAQEFVDTIQEMYGLDPTTIMQITSEFYNLASAVETPTAAAEKMSMGLTNAALNIASLFDVDITTVAENLNSGMQGMTRAVRKYGLDLRMATLETTALAYGLQIDADTTSEANRQALRYLTIIRQSRVATGDFAKTIESPANQMRIFKEQVSQLARALGNLFLPVIQKILPYINGLVMALRTLLQFFGSLLGISTVSFEGMTDAAKELDSSIQSAGTSADGLKKKIQALTAPFDELNVLQENTNSSSSSGTGGTSSDTLDPTLAKAIEDLNVKLEETRMKANDVRDNILDFLGFSWNKEGKLTFDASQLEENLINKFPSWTQTITAVFDNWDGIAAGFVAVWDALGKSILSLFQGIAQGFTNMIQSFNLDQIVADWITQLPDRLQAIADWLNNNQALFVTMGELIAYVGTAFATWKVITQVLSIFSQLSGIITAVTSPIGLLVAAVVLLVAGFVEAYNNSDRFRESLTKVKDSASELWESISELLTTLWETLEPVLAQIGDALMFLWNDIVSPLLLNIIDLVLEVLNVAVEVIDRFCKTYQPMITDALQIIADAFDNVIRFICGLLDGVIQVLQGVVEFIDGVFSGDLEEAWQGIQDMFKGTMNFLITCFESAVNGIIDLVNLLLGVVLGALESFVNMLLEGVEWVADLVGVELNLPHLSQVPKIQHVQVPRLAEGGVVDSPTLSMIGEGKYPEAVIPLGDSPQMKNLVQQIADKLDSTSSNNDTPIQVTMYLDSQVLYKSVQRTSRERGVDFKMGAFQR